MTDCAATVRRMFVIGFGHAEISLAMSAYVGKAEVAFQG